MSPLRKKMQVYARADTSQALGQVATTLLPLAAIWAAMLSLVGRSLPLTMLLAIPAAALMLRVFVIAHDCGHGSFFPSRRANDVLGFFLGVLSLTPYRYWQLTHNAHHAASGNLDRRGMGDVTTLTVLEYAALSPMQRLGYRLLRNPVVLLGIGPILLFGIKHRFPWDLTRAHRREWTSVLATNAALLGMGMLARSTVGVGSALKVLSVTWLLAHSVGIWIFYVQHQFEHAYWARSESWDYERAALAGSTFLDLPPLLRWVTGSIGYHHIHHLVSRIPNYQLAMVQQAFATELHPVRIGIADGFAALRLNLWDEERGRMVSFADAVRRQTPDSLDTKDASEMFTHGSIKGRNGDANGE